MYPDTPRWFGLMICFNYIKSLKRDTKDVKGSKGETKGAQRGIKLQKRDAKKTTNKCKIDQNRQNNKKKMQTNQN